MQSLRVFPTFLQHQHTNVIYVYVSVCPVSLLSSLSSQILKLEKPKPKVSNPFKDPQLQQPQQSQPTLDSLKPEERNQATTLSQMQVPISSSSGPQAEYMARRGSLLVSENRLTGSTRMRRYDSHSLLSENSIASSRFDLAEGVPYPE